MGKICQIENWNVGSLYRNPNSMKTLLRSSLAALAGLLMISPALANHGVVRCQVRDVNGRPRTVYVRASDNRILYPKVIQQIARPGGRMEYRPAISSAYRPDSGYGVFRPGYGQGAYGLPGRRFYPVNNGYPNDYRPTGNYGVDSILYNGNRGYFGIPGYGLPGGAFPRPVVPPQSSVIQIPRFSGSQKGK